MRHATRPEPLGRGCPILMLVIARVFFFFWVVGSSQMGWWIFYI